MNRVLILSDSHGLTNELMEIKQRHNLEHIIHCGDSELSIHAPELTDSINVRGNCDYIEPFPEEEMIKIGDLSLFITHGHLYKVKKNLTTLEYKAEEKGANVVCFGHTHVAMANNIGGVLFINPGSIRQPKEITEKTYAIMSFENRDKVCVHFYNLKGEEVTGLYYETTIT